MNIEHKKIRQYNQQFIMAKYNELLTQSNTSFDANHQNRDSNIADKNESLKILLKQNIIRSYGGNDEVVVENIDFTRNTFRYYTVVGCN